MHMPLLLLTSPQDHVVEPSNGDFLAESYGGPVERISLERSYHVATQDYDKDLIFEATTEFAGRVAAS
jgi:carboxylesterase